MQDHCPLCGAASNTDSCSFCDTPEKVYWLGLYLQSLITDTVGGPLFKFFESDYFVTYVADDAATLVQGLGADRGWEERYIFAQTSMVPPLVEQQLQDRAVKGFARGRYIGNQPHLQALRWEQLTLVSLGDLLQAAGK